MKATTQKRIVDIKGGRGGGGEGGKTLTSN